MAPETALDMQDLLEIDALPTLPQAALEVLRLSKDPNAGLSDVVRCVEHNPALATKVMQTANSAAYSRGDAATSLPQAATRLGMRSMKIIVLAFSLASEFPSGGNAGGIELRDYWDRSLATAVAARLIAQEMHSPLAEEAFLCGLLSNIGRICLGLGMADKYADLDRADDIWPSPNAEQQIFGFTATDVATALLDRWKLPANLIEAIAQCNDPSQPDEDLAAIVYSARRVAEFRHTDDLQRTFEQLSTSLATLGLSDENIDQVVDKLDLQLEESAEIMGVDLPVTISARDIVSQARTQLMNITLEASLELEQATTRTEELMAQNAELEEVTLTDRLTRLPNRLAFDEFIDVHVSTVERRMRHPQLGVAMIDIDHFKLVNDTYGHAVGDDVLRMLGSTFLAGTRTHETICRIGGEEFAFIAAGISERELIILCERLRSLAESMPSEPKVTISIGFSAGDCSTMADVEALLADADAKLYEAKRSGRNKVVGAT